MSKNEIKRTISRNPTPEELEELRQTGAAKAVPKSKSVVAEAPSAKNETEGTLKPDTNIFEPKPHLFRLPSGHCNSIPETHLVDGNSIYIRRLAGNEEDTLMEIVTGDITFNAGANKIVNNCIKTDVSVEDLSMVDKLAAFVFILAITYGEKHKVTMDCQECYDYEEGKAMGKETRTINLHKDVVVKYVPEHEEYPKSFELTTYGTPITIRMHFPTVADEKAFYSKTRKIELNNTEQTLEIVDSIDGLGPDGNPITREQWADVIEYLNHEDKTAIKEYISEFADYGTAMRVKMKCDNTDCDYHNKKNETTLPLDQILSGAYASKKR